MTCNVKFLFLQFCKSSRHISLKEYIGVQETLQCIWFSYTLCTYKHCMNSIPIFCKKIVYEGTGQKADKGKVAYTDGILV